MDNKKYYHKSDIVCMLLMITMIAKDGTLKVKDLAEVFGRAGRKSQEACKNPGRGLVRKKVLKKGGLN